MQRHIQTAFAFQLACLVALAVVFRHALNPDAVAYLQLARHYADGQLNLAISGYWSPLISWMLALLLKVGLPSLIAARLFMIFSGMVFLWGSLRLFRQFNLSDPLLLCGLWLMALLSIPWSVENITPDLLSAGLIVIAVSQMTTSEWLERTMPAIICGATWGLAFLAKSAALPLGVLCVVGAVLWWKKRGHNWHQVGKTLCVTLAGTFVVSALWVTVLTVHYGKLTIANSAIYNHALVGPGIKHRYFLLDEGLKIPPAGRVTIWEDPVSPYPDWPIFASLANVEHEFEVVLANTPVALVMACSVTLVFPVVLVVALLLCLRRWNLAGYAPKFWMAFMPVLFMLLLYLPNYLLISEQRYFYAMAPWLFVAAATCGLWSGRRLLLLTFLFIAPVAARTGIYLNSTRLAGDCAHVLAQKISQNHLAGTVVGSAKIHGGRCGLYVAYLLQQPWFGDEPAPTATDYKASGADLIAVKRNSAIARSLTTDSQVENLDPVLFGTQAGVQKCPVQIFRNRQ